eukprot:1822811-Rhodomonas_salina.1
MDVGRKMKRAFCEPLVLRLLPRRATRLFKLLPRRATRLFKLVLCCPRFFCRGCAVFWRCSVALARSFPLPLSSTLSALLHPLSELSPSLPFSLSLLPSPAISLCAATAPTSSTVPPSLWQRPWRCGAGAP